MKIQISLYNVSFLLKIIRLKNSGSAFSPGHNQLCTGLQPLIFPQRAAML